MFAFEKSVDLNLGIPQGTGHLREWPTEVRSLSKNIWETIIVQFWELFSK